MATSAVRVVVRVRPQMENELISGGQNIAFFDNTGKTITVDGQRKATFTFDRAFNPDSTQDEVYTYAAKPIVEDVLKGYNGTIFAYGQTSSGKTHTMEGPDIDGPDRGIIPRIVQNIFQYIELAPETLEFTVRVSYFEIYMEKIRDLLCDGNDNLQIHENRERGVYVRHATELFMQDPEEVMEVMRSGADRRSVASTQMNDISSRSHSVFLMEISQKDTIKGGMKTGKLYLVDLAGSEKVSKTGADGEVLEEAKNINKSLSALGLVIMSLTENQARHHVPYRDSKLTRILQESLGGNARTTIIICCSPSSYNEAETLSSLRFGQRAKKIKNNAVVNQQYSAEELTKQLDAAKKEIKKLVKKLQAAEKELEIWRQGGSVSEAERVALGAAVGGDEDGAARAAAEDGGDAAGSGGGGGGGGSAMTDEEREELLRSQNELLELIDEKDETIRQLEREVEVLGQDKITITKLASENAAKGIKISELEEKFDEAVAENTEYEIIIEDMARANNRLDEEHNRTKQELERLIEQSKSQEAQNQAIIQSIADMVGALAAGKISGSTRQLPVPLMETGTVVDAQLSKARAFISQLQADLSQTKKTKDEVNDDATKSKARLDTVESSLSAAKLTIAQLEQNLAELTQKTRSLDAEKRELHLKNEALSSELTDYMDKLILAEEACEKSKQEAGARGKSDAEVNELKAALERQREAQREQHQQQLKDLHAQVDNISKERQQLAYERDKLQLEINQLRSDLDKKTTAVQQQQEKIENLSQRVEQTERAEKETQGISEATKSQLEAYNVLKTKMMENLMTRMRTSIGERAKPAAPAAAANEKDSKHVEFLQKTIDQLNVSHTEAVKEKTALQRENASLQKQLESSRENLANLRTLMTETESRLMNAHQRHKQDVSAERSKPRMVRRKSQNAAQSAPVVRRGGDGKANASADATKAKFWEDQSKQSTNTPASARNSGITGQGQPLVGQHANRPPSSPAVEKALEVEYV